MKNEQELQKLYLSIFVRQLKDIQYRKWKAIDRCLSFMRLKNSL